MLSTGLVALLLCATGVQVEPQEVVFGPAGVPLVFTVPGAVELEVVAANGAGSVSAATPAGEGRFRARFTPPRARTPQLALLLLRATSAAGEPSRHWLALRLVANARLEVETKPGARVTVAIGSATFGPATASNRGRVTISARVPPGIPFAQVKAIDRARNETTTPLDLKVQPLSRAVALLVAPAATPDGPVDLELFAVQPDGTPLEAAEGLEVTPKLGTCAAPVRLGGGRFTVAYRAPASIAAGSDTVTVGLAGSAVTTVLVPLGPGAPARVALTPSAPVYVAGTPGGVQVAAKVTDAQGNPVESSPPRLTVDFGRAESTAEGYRVVVPDHFDGRRQVRVRATAGAASGELDLVLRAAAPATAELQFPETARAGESAEGQLRVTDAFGNPVAAEAGGVQVVSSGGQAASLTAADDGSTRVAYQVPKEQPPGAEELEVRAGEVSLARRALATRPYQRPWGVVAGVFLGGHWNFGQARSAGPRVSLGLRVGRLPLEVGLEGAFTLYPHLEQATTTDAQNDASVDMTAVSAALAARTSVPLGTRWAVHLAAALGAQRTASTVWAVGLEPRSDAAWGPLATGSGGVAVHALGGRLVLQLEFTWAQVLGQRQVRGNVGGAGATLGYLVDF